MNTVKKAWANALVFAITLVINTLGAIGLINGLNQKQISDKYLTLITPSPSTFSIWGVIYTLLLISIIVMIIKKDDPYYQKAIDKISGLFIISCLLNAAWIVTFSFVQIELSVLFILGFVITLSLICQRLLQIQDRKRWLLPLTFGLYTGWLFIATVVNISAALVKLKWNGFGIAPEMWATIILIISVLLVIFVMLKNHNAVFPLPVAWAYWGIYQNLNTQDVLKGTFSTIQTVAVVGMIVLILAAAFQFYRNKWQLLPSRD